MPEPIVVRIIATPDPDNSTNLILTTDPEAAVLLSLEDEDQVRWVCDAGEAEIVFASENNPFDPNIVTGGEYETQPGGSQPSGPLNPVLFPEPDDRNYNPDFKVYKYSIVVKSGDRQGSIDPRVMGRWRRVYRP